MANTDSFVTKGSSASDTNGGGPRLGADDGPVERADNCSYTAFTDYFVNDDGNWVNTQEGDWFVWDVGGVNGLYQAEFIVDDKLYPYGGIEADAASGKTIRVGGAWEHIDHATDTITTSFVNDDGDPPRVNIKAGTYTETCTVDNAGDHDLVITYEGYTATPGDGGLDESGDLSVIIDGEDSHGCIATSLGTGIYLNYIFRNIRCTRSDTHGFNLYANTVRYENCEADHNGNCGIYGFYYCSVIGGKVYDNVSGYGIQFVGWGSIVNVKVYGNYYGIRMGWGGVTWCTLRHNAIANVMLYSMNRYPCYIAHNTIDGVDKTDKGILVEASGSDAHVLTVIDNIITRCSVGIDCNAGMENALVFSGNNLLYDNTDDYDVDGYWPHTTGDITGEDPKFVDQDNRDYGLLPDSPAIRAGWPTNTTIGAVPLPAMGILGGPNKRGGKQ